MKLLERLDRLLENNLYWSQTLGRYIDPPKSDEVKCPECGETHSQGEVREMDMQEMRLYLETHRRIHL